MELEGGRPEREQHLRIGGIGNVKRRKVTGALQRSTIVRHPIRRKLTRMPAVAWDVEVRKELRIFAIRDVVKRERRVIWSTRSFGGSEHFSRLVNLKRFPRLKHSPCSEVGRCART